MYIVAFEETTRPDRSAIAGAYYLRLQPILKEQSGFISETPLTSTTDENKHLLLAKFKDQEAAEHWRKTTEHLQIQHKARTTGVFQDYRIRVGNTIPEEEWQPLADENESDNIPSSDKNHRCLSIFEELKSNRSSDGDIFAAGPYITKDHSGHAIDVYENEDVTVTLATGPSKTGLIKSFLNDSMSGDWGLDRGNVRHLMRIERWYGMREDERAEAREGAEEEQTKASEKL